MATSTLISRVTTANITSTQSIPSTSVAPTTCSYLDMHIILDGGTITVIVLGILFVLASIGAIWMRQRRRGRLRPNGHRDTEEIGRAGGDEMESQVALNRLSEQASIDRHHEAGTLIIRTLELSLLIALWKSRAPHKQTTLPTSSMTPPSPRPVHQTRQLQRVAQAKQD